ncbi:MAG: stage II sporulation protein P [Clostridia bacterium]|nr:stage II sporulation protein P [Clostridia bacterium]
MEDKQLVLTEDISVITGEVRERIEPDAPVMVKRKISLYFWVTISTLIFIIAFSFADLGADIAKSGRDELPSLIASRLSGDLNSKVKFSLSEYLSGRMFGISKSRATEILSVGINFDSDEHDKSEGSAVNNEDALGTGETTSILNGNTSILPDTNKNEDEKPSINDVEEQGKKYPIVSMDLAHSVSDKYYIGNETGYTPNVKALLSKESVIPTFSEIKDNKEPLVLIMHTHGTEAYSEDGKDYYFDNGGELWRTHDKEKNVVAIGKLMAEILNREGINTLHCEIMHDKESYQDSYNRAAETIREYLVKYPTIEYVFDVHRDAILKSDGTLVKAVSDIDGRPTAQVMTVVGSNYKGANFSDWEDHLSLALKLKENLEKKGQDISRPVYLRGAAYNQQYTKGSLLLEIGTSGNTFEEARNAGELVALALADIIKGKEYN